MKIFNFKYGIDPRISWILTRRNRENHQPFDVEGAHLNVLFVCTANLCRSPMAEGILNRQLHQSSNSGIRVFSAGTLVENGRPVSPVAVKIAEANDIDIRSVKTTRIHRALMLHSDVILVMERYHFQTIKEVFPFVSKKTFLLKDFYMEDRPCEEIADPGGESPEVYQACFSEIKTEIMRIYPLLEALSRKKRRLLQATEQNEPFVETIAG